MYTRTHFLYHIAVIVHNNTGIGPYCAPIIVTDANVPDYIYI